jgi:hypothetical protein
MIDLPRPFHYLMLSLIMAAVPIALLLYPPARADAAYYSGQQFCWYAYGGVIPPGARCVGPENPRLSKISVGGSIAGLEVCVVGRANPDGSGENRYPLTCSTGGSFSGPTRSEAQALVGYPVIINRSPETIVVGGAWNGWFP